MSKSVVRVLLVDDHSVVRAGLKALLESTGRVDVVGEASSGEAGVEKALALAPDIVTMDLAMPGMDGLDATRRITELGLEAKVLVLTVHDVDELLLPALEAGAAGVLDKSVADTDLMGALDALVRGHAYLPRRAAALLARRKA
ncbi:MAG: response regulator transcription factor [Gemmatimonadetes bacterium]|nr:response regulator transcription factor [Gemmatimonadota bacterium]